MPWNQIVSIVRAGGYSVQGIVKAARHERAFRQELFFFVPGTVIAAFICRGAGEFALLVLPFLFALSLELMNSAVERTVDRGGTEPDPLAGDAKDFASGAVFLANTTAFVIWAVYLFNRFF